MQNNLYCLLDGDLDDQAHNVLARSGEIALDIETTGLSPFSDSICLIQVTNGHRTYVVRPNNGRIPSRLLSIIEDSAVLKVFHYALFDLSFIAHAWPVRPTNCVCTKVSSKLLKITEPSLQHLLKIMLGIRIDKHEQMSEWNDLKLTEAQIRYSVTDVIHLIPLFSRLRALLEERGLRELADRCFSHIPTRVSLDLGGYPDVYMH